MIVLRKRSTVEKVVLRRHEPKKIQNPIDVLARARLKPDKLIYPNETPLPQPKFPPEKRHVDLDEFLKTNDECRNGFYYYHRRTWFENANYLFRPEFDEDEPQFAFAQSKDAYVIQRQDGSAYYFDMGDAHFDSRFVCPELPQGKLRFGNFHDNQLGRTFYLTEPENANDMLLSFTELIGICEWLEHDPNVKYFYHETRRFCLHVVLPVGSRLDLDRQFVITHPTSPEDDRKFFTKLFMEKLHHAVDFRFTETRYVRPLTEAEQVSKKHRANYADRLKALTEKFDQICKIRRISTTSPFDDPVSIYYKGYTYLYNDADMSRLEVVVDTDFEFYQKLEKRVEFVDSLISGALKNTLEEFDVKATLQLDREYMLVGCSKELIILEIFREGDYAPIHRHSVDLDEFNAPSESSIAEEFVRDAEKFFNNHREKFHAFKKLYDANLAYHQLVNPSSSLPELDYDYIFRTL